MARCCRGRPFYPRCCPCCSWGRGKRVTAKLPDPYQCVGPGGRRCARLLVQYVLLAFVLLIVLLWIGMEIQEYYVKSADDTLHFYTLPQVCGVTSQTKTTGKSNEDEPDFMLIQTFPSAEDAQNSPETFVGHCGDCGYCSTPQDIQIYDDTKNSLFGDSVECAKKGLVWGRKTTRKCMDERVGFTEGCNDCWVENIMCDLKKCIFICLWHGLFSQVEDGTNSQELNRCTLCDEKRCGPDFIQCAGANRRRSGIVSDIERDSELEVCDSVRPQWWVNETLQSLWREQNGALLLGGDSDPIQNDGGVQAEPPKTDGKDVNIMDAKDGRSPPVP